MLCVTILSIRASRKRIHQGENVNQNIFLNKIHLINTDRKQFTQLRMRTQPKKAISNGHLNNYTNILQTPTRHEKR